jgi:glycosyltransferase involved in cell wall biosynthesis
VPTTSSALRPDSSLSRLGSDPTSRPARLLVFLPALDEASTIAGVIDAIPRVIDGVAEVSVLVVDDGSGDDTSALARQAGAQVIRHDTPRGVGAAFHTALAHARALGVDLFVTIDADGQFDPQDIPRLIAPVLAGDADLATASRFLDPALSPEMPRIKRWGNRQVARIVSRLTGRRFRDVSCGMRCYSRRALLYLNPLGTFTYTHEVFLDLCFRGLPIVEVPIRVRGEREFGSSRVAKSLVRYALHTIRILVGSYRDYKPLRFFGAAAGLLFVPALLLELFLVGHYLSTGSFSPHKWAGFTGAGLALLAVLVAFMGMIGDMLNRHRVYLEELLYEQRRRNVEPSDPAADATPRP